MSAFDVSAFLDTTTTEANSRRDPLPTTESYIGTLGEPKFRSFQGTKDPTQTYTVQDWSPRQLQGKTVRVYIKHEPHKETGELYDRVASVTKV